MLSKDDAALSERRMVADGLRLWARTADPDELLLTGAAVELVIRAHGGHFADAGWPWIVEGHAADPLGLFRLDADVMAAWDHGRPEHPVMDFVEALAGGRPVRQLARLLNILDNPTRRLVLCAFRHAAAQREVAVYAFGGDLSPLVDGAKPALRFWPVGELDVYDRPALQPRPRLQVTGGAR
jgi:hypothetical protein